MKGNINLVLKKKDCCGCGLCMNVCPQQAISMREDQAGFVYPFIDEKKCVECHLCEKRCAFQKIEEKKTLGITYAARIRDKNVLKKSASGGIFAAFAIAILEENGVVFGAAYHEEDGRLKVKHVEIDTIKDLWKVQGSKYVQSDIGFTYQQVQRHLKNGRRVLYSGTPCQIAGLKSFLGKEYENLLLIDLVCHGVPSSKMFCAYIRELQKEKKGRIKNFCFREKENGWGLQASYQVQRANTVRKKYIKPGESSYYNLFLEGKVYRDSCYNCKYASERRSGDITIGDYWGIESVHPDLVANKMFDVREGISGILVNTERGKEYFKTYCEKLEVISSTFSKFSEHNEQLKHASFLPDDREKYINMLEKNGYIKFHRRFNQKIRRAKIIHLVGLAFPKKLKKYLDDNKLRK